MTRSAAMTLAVLAALVAVVRAVGGQGEPWQAEGWTTLFEGPAEWFMQFIEGASRLVKGGSDGASFSARLGCLLLLILLFVALRRWMLMYYAHKPGAVDVKKLVSSAPGMEQQLEGLSAQLRKQLSETNLYPPTALPAEAPADNFLDLLGDVDLEPKKLGTSLLRLFSRLRPKIAYTVRGVLRLREQEPGFGITVTSYAIRGSRTESIWSRSWEDAIQEAGYWAVAGHPGRPASPLAGVVRPGPAAELFAAYQQARELSGQRKFDDALESYYEALRFDPTNLYLRTQIAGIQEQLWLHLDALETYYGALRLDGRKKARSATRGQGCAPGTRAGPCVIATAGGGAVSWKRASATPSSSGWRSGPPISGARATIRPARGGRTPGSRSGRPSPPRSPHGTGVPSRGSSRPAGPSPSGRTRKDPSA
ncbi:hypothetical protein ACN24K_32135 [Streptomyces microflavus]